MMAKAKHRRKSRKHQTTSLLLIGSGLVIFALVLTIVLLQQDTSASNTAEIGVTPARVNFAAPELSLNDLEGKAVTLEDLRGQVVLLNNWATWCPPCRAEMPVLNAYHEDHESKGFTIIAVDAGEPAADVRNFAENMALSFPVWLDPDMDTIRAFRNDGLPSSYVINREGQVVLAWNGAITREALEQYVTPLLEN
jgi:cytochrome c biogenesis protein CcmG, thiol:disulfide interchange protein DsbE